MELNNLASKQYIDFKDLVSGTNLLASSLEKSFSKINWNEIRNYPEMANYLNEIFDLFEDP